MKEQLRLLSFANIDLKYIPKKNRLEYQVNLVGEDYEIVPAPIILKDSRLLGTLYYDFDKLTELEQDIYDSKKETYTKKENGNYKLETKQYILHRKHKIN